ncbi:MAG: hypothetical protein K1X35_07275 [Caulobacteraceae bacterium]|nr:hypothetical protein [Caulobacteraceae bacterium]
MSERFTVRLARLISQALGPNPLDAICPEMPEHDVSGSRARIIRLVKGPQGPLRRLSAA